MNLLTGLHWLTSKSAGNPAADEAFDPADMGTAFGLDASMAPEPEPERSPVPESAAPGWSRRLDRRPQR